jgi:4-hydroxy-tetrahydrodipicolinate synthase
VRLWELAVADQDAGRAREFWQYLFPLTHFFESHGYAQAVRTATNARGIAVGNPRSPALPLTDSELPELRQLLALVDEGLAKVLG